MIGEETEVERTVFELLGDPLVHLARNAMDHGLESPEIRKEKGKNPVGKLTVSAKQSGGSVIIEIIEDGAGINRDKVLKKAVERNLVPEGVDPESLSDDHIFQFIFAPGFSTADKVSDLSGRGVGMDVVKSNLDRIHGKIDIRSKPNEGTIFRLSIPLSTAITDGIVVAIDGSRFILPIHNIREIVRCLPSEYTHMTHGKVVRIREVILPVIDIHKTIGKINWSQAENLRYEGDLQKNSLRSRRDETMLVIIESMYGQMALPVQDVIGQAQVVVKAMTSIQNIPEISGAAIMGDGRTILILDPTALVQQRKTDIGSAA
jgi:two-component system chemotaxis sensor kinase CheA